jgi:hypothetical protein
MNWNIVIGAVAAAVLMIPAMASAQSVELANGNIIAPSEKSAPVRVRLNVDREKVTSSPLRILPLGEQRISDTPSRLRILPSGGQRIGSNNRRLSLNAQNQPFAVTGDGNRITLKGKFPLLVISGDNNHVTVASSVKVENTGKGNVVTRIREE